ncbi:hypothetical protein F9230_08535 [Acinetobacter johnsonii]|uniref:hypothetical protein n=1 Tax=Acinetobacter johnsonii TaxID=40214 RepID=UPI001F4598FB|nr:hypothetical protein [Acinetobacter johnsonii]UJA04390.1 hypothetical protein F9230_08535 [Acinetobacter johnsonii]
MMEIQKIPTLAEKQEFWAEQLPNFETTYWLPSHFEYVVFDMEQGNYVIKDGFIKDFDEDATEIWHRVNTGWAMWKKAINFSRKQAQAVPEGFVLVPVKEIKTWYLDDSENIYREDPEWLCDIPVGEVVEVEHRVSYELDQDPLFAAIQWDEENSDVGYYETFKSKAEAEKVAAHCKAMVEAQEQSHD